MECQEKYIPNEEWIGGKEFDRSQAKQRECLNQESTIDWEAMQPALDRAAGSIGLILNEQPLSFRILPMRFLADEDGELPPGRPACIKVVKYATEGALFKPLCHKHPKYHAINAPRAECTICWDAWDAKRGLEGYNHG